MVEADWSVPHALARVVSREHPDLLVLGSSRHAPARACADRYAHASATGRSEMLAGCRAHAACPRKVRGRLAVIGAGYDGTPEAEQAIRQAGSLARAADARLRVRAVVDDRLPVCRMDSGAPLRPGDVGRGHRPRDRVAAQAAQREASATGADFTVEVGFGAPVDELIALSGEVDLLVIGSRRWGPAVRVLLGSTGEALMHNAQRAR